MSLLYTKQPVVINPHLAKSIGLNEAIVLQQLHYWLSDSKSGGARGGIEVDGIRWVHNTLEEWQSMFPFWSTDTIMRIFKNLKACGLIFVEQKNKSTYDRTNFYTINYSHSALFDSGESSSNDTCNLRPSECGNLRPSLSKQRLQTEITTESKEASQAPIHAKRKKSDNLTLVKWAELQKEQGTPLLSDDDAIFAYADAIKLPKDFLLIAWHMFKAKYKSSSKTYKDWRAAFRDHVRGNYLKAWAINRDGEFYLTDAGKQAQMERGAL